MTTKINLCISLLICMFLVSCSNPPSQDLLVKDFMESSSDITNVQVVREVHCPPLSAEAKAQGIDDAWLVNFNYDYKGSPPVYNYVYLYTKIGGTWYRQGVGPCP